jgi:hypothetical protein
VPDTKVKDIVAGCLAESTQGSTAKLKGAERYRKRDVNASSLINRENRTDTGKEGKVVPRRRRIRRWGI